MARVLHFDCFSGISGDMTVAALLDLGVPEPLLVDALASLQLDGKLEVRKVRKNGLAATQIAVVANDTSHHRHLPEIRRIIDRGQLTDGARGISHRMFDKLAEAESAVHGIPLEKVHFHEVGAIDSIFDFVAIAVGIDWLKPVRVTSRPVPTGGGFIDCDHGRMPIPPPAVARLLTNIPIASSTIQAELTTPTGAAVLATLVDQFLEQPEMTIERIGIGAGARDLEDQPNVLRLFVGDAAVKTDQESPSDRIWQLETNVDDTTPEVLGYTTERLLEAGALDVFVIPIQMKKNRPGVLLGVLCGSGELSAVESVIFRETGTFGIRKWQVERTKLARSACQVNTEWGPVRGKLGWNAETRIFTPEYDDCARIARAHGLPLQQIYRNALRRYEASNGADAES